MTSYEVARALLRRWWVVVGGLVVTVAFVSTHAPAAPLYWARYDLFLVAPDQSGEVYSRTAPPASVTSLATLLEVLLDGNKPAPRAASQDVPVFGLSARPGVEVQAKDTGFQWNRDYSAALAVQIAMPSSNEVRREASVLAREARLNLKQIQDQQGVSRKQRVTVEEPSAIDVTKVTPAPTRAAAGALILGSALTVLLAVRIDRLILTRRRRDVAQ